MFPPRLVLPGFPHIYGLHESSLGVLRAGRQRLIELYVFYKVIEGDGSSQTSFTVPSPAPSTNTDVETEETSLSDTVRQYGGPGRDEGGQEVDGEDGPLSERKRQEEDAGDEDQVESNTVVQPLVRAQVL